MSIRKQVKMLSKEKWIQLKGHVSKGPIQYKYAVSNYGRIIKYYQDIKAGNLLKLSRQQGYPIWRKIMKDKYFAVLLHRLVAKHFLPKPVAKQKFVIHLDFDKENNYYKNLKWATQEEVTAHTNKNPAVIKAREVLRKNGGSRNNAKLTEAKVRQIKGLLKKGKTLKELASRYNVSDMQIYRIKSGENWGHVK